MCYGMLPLSGHLRLTAAAQSWRKCSYYITHRHLQRLPSFRSQTKVLKASQPHLNGFELVFLNNTFPSKILKDLCNIAGWLESSFPNELQPIRQAFQIEVLAEAYHLGSFLRKTNHQTQPYLLNNKELITRRSQEEKDERPFAVKWIRPSTALHGSAIYELISVCLYFSLLWELKGN